MKEKITPENAIGGTFEEFVGLNRKRLFDEAMEVSRVTGTEINLEEFYEEKYEIETGFKLNKSKEDKMGDQAVEEKQEKKEEKAEETEASETSEPTEPASSE